jgi:hypothetical protein
VKAIFRLIEYDRRWRFEDLISDFEGVEAEVLEKLPPDLCFCAVKCRQAV